MDNKNPKNKDTKENEQTSTQFDKFIQDQLKREKSNSDRKNSIVKEWETPQQKYNKLYRENPGNRTVWRKK